MGKQRYRDLGGVLARRDYDTKSMHHRFLYGTDPKSKQFKAAVSYAEILKQLQAMIAEDRIYPKLKVGKFRYRIEKEAFIPVFGKLITYVQKWNKYPEPTWWVQNSAWICPDQQIRSTIKYLYNVYKNMKKKKLHRFDLVLSRTTWNHLRSDYDKKEDDAQMLADQELTK